MAGYKYTGNLSLNQLLNMDPEQLLNLPKPALREATSRLASAANKRIKRSGKEPSPAVKQAKRGGAFSTKGKDVISLRNEFVRAKRFLSDRTSTAKGWRDFKKETAKKLKDAGWNVNPDNVGEMLDKFDKLTQADGEVLDRGHRYKYLRELTENVTDREGNATDEEKDGSAILDALASALRDLEYSGLDYDTEDYSNAGGVSQFFELL